jgi:hypothetical protein
MVVHVVLKVGLTIDDPIIRQVGAPETEVVNLRVSVGFFNRIFHFDHNILL